MQCEGVIDAIYVRRTCLLSFLPDSGSWSNPVETGAQLMLNLPLYLLLDGLVFAQVLSLPSSLYGWWTWGISGERWDDDDVSRTHTQSNTMTFAFLCSSRHIICFQAYWRHVGLTAWQNKSTHSTSSKNVIHNLHHHHPSSSSTTIIIINQDVFVLLLCELYNLNS